MCTCQWETVLTHQIMAERKLLQGCDIFRWQYGDVQCTLGGGPPLLQGPGKKTKITFSFDMHIYREREKEERDAHAHF